MNVKDINITEMFIFHKTSEGTQTYSRGGFVEAFMLKSEIKKIEDERPLLRSDN